MLNYAGYENEEKDDDAKKILRNLSRTIEESQTLRAKVKNCLYSLSINENYFDQMQVVISSLGKTNVLYLVNKAEMLTSLLKNLKIKPNIEFLKKWFYKFLLFNENFSEMKKREFIEVFNAWTKLFVSNQQYLTEILRDLDAMIDAFGSQNPFQAVFIQLMIDLCFRQSQSNTID